MRRAQRWVAGVATAALLTTMSASPAAAAAAGEGAPRTDSPLAQSAPEGAYRTAAHDRVAAELDAAVPAAAQEKIFDSAGVDMDGEVLAAYDTLWSEAAHDRDLSSSVVPLTATDGGGIGFADVASGREMSLALAGTDEQATDAGVTVARDADRDVSAVSHVSEAGAGQVIAVADASAGYVDYSLTLPEGSSLEARADGSLDIVDAAGATEGRIAAPWAFDQNGVALETRYDVRSDGTLRQHFTPVAGSFRVVLDPSAWWWAATGAKCAAELAITFTPLKLAKVTKSIASVAQRSATVRRAVDRLGGAYNAAVKTVQYQANELKRKANGAAWAKAIPSFRMTSQQKQDAARISGFLGGNVWTLLGFGSCAELVMELRR